MKPPEIIVRTAVRALITDQDDRLLVLRRQNSAYCNGWWNLPGGKIDYGQTAEQAVAREVEEETQLQCTSSGFLFYMDNLPTEAYDTHFLTLFFHCRCTGEIVLNDESAEYYWLESDELDAFRLAFEHDKAIRMFWDLTSKL